MATTKKKVSEVDRIVKVLDGMKYTEAHNVLERVKEVILSKAVVQSVPKR
jgi:ribosomal protein L22